MSTRLCLYGNPLRQAFSASTWRAAWYLLAYQLVGWVLFAAAVTAMSTAAILAITVAGMPLLVIAGGLIRAAPTPNAADWARYWAPRSRAVTAGSPGRG